MLSKKRGREEISRAWKLVREGKEAPGASGEELRTLIGVERDLLRSKLLCTVCHCPATNERGDFTFLSSCGHPMCSQCSTESGKMYCRGCRARVSELCVLPPFLRNHPFFKARKKFCGDCKSEYSEKNHNEHCPERKALYAGALVTASKLLDVVAKNDTKPILCARKSWLCDLGIKEKTVFDFVFQAQKHRLIFVRFMETTLISFLTVGPATAYLRITPKDHPQVEISACHPYVAQGEFHIVGARHYDNWPDVVTTEIIPPPPDSSDDE